MIDNCSISKPLMAGLVFKSTLENFMRILTDSPKSSLCSAVAFTQSYQIFVVRPVVTFSKVLTSKS